LRRIQKEKQKQEQQQIFRCAQDDKIDGDLEVWRGRSRADPKAGNAYSL
jgi:hypothetical protein